MRGISHPSTVADKVLWQEFGIFTLPERIICSFSGLMWFKEEKKKKSNAVLFKSDHFKYKQKKLLLEICQKSFSLFVKLLFHFPLTRAE